MLEVQKFNAGDDPALARMAIYIVDVRKSILDHWEL